MPKAEDQHNNFNHPYQETLVQSVSIGIIARVTVTIYHRQRGEMVERSLGHQCYRLSQYNDHSDEEKTDDVQKHRFGNS